MHADYIMTPEKAANLAAEYIRQAHGGRKRHLRWWIIAVSGGCAISFFCPPELQVNGISSTPLTVAIAVLIQIPLVALMIFFILKMVGEAPIHAVSRFAKEQPKDFSGPRTLEVEDGRIVIRSKISMYAIESALVENVLETKSGYHLTHGNQVLLSIPRSVGSLADLKTALRQHGLKDTSRNLKSANDDHDGTTDS